MVHKFFLVSVVIILSELCIFTRQSKTTSLSNRHHRNKDSHFNGIEGPLQISLEYCKNKAILLKRPLASRHCIRRWNLNYNKFCVTSSRLATSKCKRLKNKASRLRDEVIYLKLRAKQPRRLECGERKINPTKYGCCSSVRFRLVTQGCCGDNIYNTAKQACCNLQVHDIDGATRTRCCGDELFDVELFFCYNGTIKQKQSVVVIENTAEVHSNIRPNTHHIQVVVIIIFSVIILVALTGSILIISWLSRRYLVKSFSRNYLSVPVNSVDYSLMPSTSETFSLGENMKGLGTDVPNESDVELRIPDTIIISGGNRRHGIGDVDKSLFEIPNGDENSSRGTNENDTSTHLAAQESIADTPDAVPGDANSCIPVLNNETTLDGPENASDKNGGVVDNRVSELNSETSLNDLEHNSYKPYEASHPTTDVSGENFHVSHVDTAVQTSEEKPLNVRNSLGQPFDLSFFFGPSNKTLQLPNSDVTLTLSKEDTKDTKQCLASTFRNLSKIAKKLNLKDNELIASPAVEYRFINTKLRHLAKVSMSFVGDSATLVVLKVKSDEGVETPLQVQEIRKKDEHTDENVDEYYEIISSGKLAIYVRSMSWLVCKNCPDKHKNFHLDVMLYGKLDANLGEPGKYQVSMAAYIIDEIYFINDYNQVIVDNEKVNGRSYLKRRKVLLPSEVTMDDAIQVQLELNTHDWKHKTDLNGHVIQPEKQDLPVHNITGCHAQRNPAGIPFSKEWRLVSKEQPNEQGVPSLECIFRTAHVTNVTGSSDLVTCQDSLDVDVTNMFENYCERNGEKKNNPPEQPRGNALPDPNPNVHQPASHIQQPKSAVPARAGSQQGAEARGGIFRQADSEPRLQRRYNRLQVLSKNDLNRVIGGAQAGPETQRKRPVGMQLAGPEDQAVGGICPQNAGAQHQLEGVNTDLDLVEEIRDIGSPPAESEIQRQGLVSGSQTGAIQEVQRRMREPPVGSEHQDQRRVTQPQPGSGQEGVVLAIGGRHARIDGNSQVLGNRLHVCQQNPNGTQRPYSDGPQQDLVRAEMNDRQTW